MCGIKTLANVVIIDLCHCMNMTRRGRGRGKKQVSGGKGPVILAADSLSHSNLDEPPSRSGSPATAKKPRKDCRITD